jgi:hypothetical protein
MFHPPSNPTGWRIINSKLNLFNFEFIQIDDRRLRIGHGRVEEVFGVEPSRQPLPCLAQSATNPGGVGFPLMYEPPEARGVVQFPRVAQLMD